MLPQGLHDSARVSPLDASIRAIQGFNDQAGGKRKRKGTRKGRKGRKVSRKGRKATRKNRKATRKNRKNRKYNGGAYSLSSAADFASPGMLLDSALEAKALSGMNAEWKLAANPGSFAPGL